METKQLFANRIKDIRVRLKLSQEELAFRCGISAAQVGYIERGERTATLETIEKLAEGLGITSSELLNYDAESKVKVYDDVTNKILSIVFGLSPAEKKRALMILKALEWNPKDTQESR